MQEKMDVLTPQQRSYNMARISGKNTKPEMALRRALWSLGLRYRIHLPLPGRPDIVFPRVRLAIFVDGCFWHRCPVHSKRPKTNAAFWEKKIAGNCERDARVNATLQSAGWSVLRCWEHDVEQDPTKTVRRIVRALNARR
jgi:DNA mismatch endonuclease, patch repair protein